MKMSLASILSSADREQKIMLLLSQLQAFLNQFQFLSDNAGITDIADRANNWLKQAEIRGSEICRYDSDLSAVTNFEPLFVLQQAHDAYLLGLLDAVPVLCRTALEEELTIRYLSAHHLLANVAGGNPFKKLVDGTTDATLENLIQWAGRAKPSILSAATEPLARDIQKAGNDFVHAYAMRRVGRPMTGAGNVFSNNVALDIYRKTLTVITQMP